MPYNPEQAYLVPPHVKDLLGEGPLCFFLRRPVARMDLRAFAQPYGEEGCPAYRAALLVGVGLYAYALGIAASRRSRRAGRVREDLASRYLAAWATPDF